MLAGAWRSPADYVDFYWLNIPVHSGYDVLMYESMDGWMDGSALSLGSNISICVIICQHQSIYLWIDISGWKFQIEIRILIYRPEILNPKFRLQFHYKNYKMGIDI